MENNEFCPLKGKFNNIHKIKKYIKDNPKLLNNELLQVTLLRRTTFTNTFDEKEKTSDKLLNGNSIEPFVKEPTNSSLR